MNTDAIALVTDDASLARLWREHVFPRDLACTRPLVLRTRVGDVLPLLPIAGLVVHVPAWNDALHAAVLRAREIAPHSSFLVCCPGLAPETVRALDAQQIGWLPPPIAPANLRAFLARVTARESASALLARSLAASARPFELTERQREIAIAFARGERREAIAARLGISIKTLERHVTAVCQRCRVRNLTELAQRVWAEVLSPRAA